MISYDLIDLDIYTFFSQISHFWRKKIQKILRRTPPQNLQKMAKLSLYVIQDRKIHIFSQNQRFSLRKKMISYDLIDLDIYTFFSQISHFWRKKIQKILRRTPPQNLQKMAKLSLCGLGGFPY